MPYKAHLADENGEPAEILAKPAELSVARKDNTWKVCVTWCRHTLSEDPESYLTVTRSWPHRETLSLTGRDNEEVFSGKVSKVSYTEDHITLEASHQDNSGPGSENMVITIETDEPGSRRALISVDNKAHGPVTISYGDGTPDEQNPGDGVTQSVHEYAQDGVYNVGAWDNEDPARNTSEQVSVPFAVGS